MSLANQATTMLESVRSRPDPAVSEGQRQRSVHRCHASLQLFEFGFEIERPLLRRNDRLKVMWFARRKIRAVDQVPIVTRAIPLRIAYMHISRSFRTHDRALLLRQKGVEVGLCGLLGSYLLNPVRGRSVRVGY